MNEQCPECGAALPAGGSCRDLFHALLGLEAEVPGGPSALAHFYAVATYVLQHPEGMGMTAEALAGLRSAVGDALSGRATMEEIRRRTRRGAEGAARVTRRDGDPVLRWPVEQWPVTVADVLAGGVAGYAGRVAAWARSVCETLERASDLA